jgi:hypothetical protein
MAAQLTAEMASHTDARTEWLSRKTLLKRIDEYNYMQYTVAAMKQKKARTEARPKA